MLNALRKYFDSFLTKIVVALYNIGFKPWHLSLLGLLLTITSCFLLLAYNDFAIVASIIIFLLGGFMDALDGQMARKYSLISSWGAFYDSLIDRICEIMYIFMLLYVNLLSSIIAFLYISTALLISYCRSRGESLGVALKGVGLMERAERVLSIAVSLILYVLLKIDLDYVFAIIVLLNVFTIGQRILQIHRDLHL